METLKTITGVEIIKPTHKETTEKLKELHYDLNKVIFRNNNKYVNSRVKERLLKTFSDIGGRIKELEVNPKAQPKKEEILKDLRIIYKRLKQYTPDLDQYNNAASKTMKYMVSSYLHMKEQNKIDTTTALAILQSMKEVRTDWLKATPPPSFVKANKELLEYLIKELTIE